MVDIVDPFEQQQPQSAPPQIVDPFEKTPPPQQRGDFSWGNVASDAWPEIKKQASSAIEDVAALGDRYKQGPLEGLATTGKAALAPFKLLASPLAGVESIGGHALANLEHTAGTYINPEVAAKDNPEQMYEQAKEDVGKALSAARPAGAPVKAPNLWGNKGYEWVAPPPKPVVAKPVPPVVAASDRLADINAPVNVPRAIASDNIATQRAGQVVRNIPFVGNNIPRAVGTMSDQMGEALGTVASHYGEGSGPNVASRVGNTISNAAEAERTAAETATQTSNDAVLADWQRAQDDALHQVGHAENTALEQARAATGEMSPQDMGQTLIERLRQDERSAQARKNALYRVAGDSDAAVQARAVRGAHGLVTDALNDAGRTDPRTGLVDPLLLPASNRMMDELRNFSNTGLPTRDPDTGRMVAGRPATAQEMEQTRKRLGNLSQAATNDADRAAARIIMDRFDEWQGHSYENALFSGSPDALEAFQNARAANRNWRQTYYNDRDDADRLINRVVTGEVTPQEMSNWIVGSGQVGAKGTASRLITRLGEATGNDPAAMDTIRSGIAHRLFGTTEGATARTPEKIASDINEFFNGSGRDVANRLFTPQQRQAALNYANAIRRGQEAREDITAVGKLTKPTPMEVGTGPMQELASAVLGKSGKTDEALFSAIDAYAKSGGRGDIKSLADIVNNIPAKDKGDLAGAIIRNIGQSNQIAGGGFSPEKFATEWNKYTPQAKTILFGNAGPHRQALDDLATIAQRYKEVGRRFGNPSGTAQNVAGFGSLLWLYSHPFTAIPTLVGGKIFAKMLAAPATAKQTTGFFKAALDMATSPTAGNMVRLNYTGNNFARAAARAGANINPTQWMQQLANGPQGPGPSNAQTPPGHAKGGKVNGYADGGDPTDPVQRLYVSPYKPDDVPMPNAEPTAGDAGAQQTASLPEIPDTRPTWLQKMANAPAPELWPQRMVRSGITLAGDVLSGREPLLPPGLRREDFTDIPPPQGPTEDSTWLGRKLGMAPVAASPYDPIYERVQDMAALGGSGGLLAGAEDASLGSGPFLRPALKYEGKIYKAPVGGEHLDALPPQLVPEFQRQALSGEDISNFDFGYMNHKGQFLNREQALDYGVKEGLIDPRDARYGTLTSTMLSDTSQPGMALSALERNFKPLRGPEASDPGYVYHATNVDRAQDIANEGLKLHKPNEFTDQNEWPDGSTEKRNYFTPTASNTWQFAPEEGQSVLLRVPKDAHPIKKEPTGDLYSTKTVPPEKIEYQKQDGTWALLKSDTSVPGAPLSALEHTQPFYSAVEKTIQSAPQQKMQGTQWANWLKNQPGVKPDELQYTGVDDWLRAQKGPVTKQQVQEYIDNNKVQVNDVEKGGNSIEKAMEKSDAAREALESAYSKQEPFVYRGEPINNPQAFSHVVGIGGIKPSELPETLRPLAENFKKINDHYNQVWSTNSPDTKYSNWQLPGGENYREHLLTLPEPMKEYNAFTEALRAKYGQGGFDNLPLTTAERTKLDNLMEKAGDEGQQPYISGHWDGKPNVLAHVRTNDRDVGGVPAMHIEEIQSDWHQAGRKKGYAEDIPQVQAYYETNGQKVPIGGGRTEAEALASSGEGWLKTLEAMGLPIKYETTYRKSAGVPDAPFKTSWPELAMKRMIAKAVDEGKSRISWTPGDAQAARYDLSKQIDRIHFAKADDGSGYMLAPESNGRTIPVNDGKIIPEEKLPDFVGKEVAQKIIDKAKSAKPYDPLTELPEDYHLIHDSHGRPGEEWGVIPPGQTHGRSMTGRYHATEQEATDRALDMINFMRRKQHQNENSVLENVDLKVGGEGMKGFYDQMMPKMVEKLGKSYGVKVKESDIRGHQYKGYSSYEASQGPTGGNAVYGIKPSGEKVLINQSYRDMNAAKDAAKELNEGGSPTKVHYFDIPKAMAEKVKKEGFPLFSDTTAGGMINQDKSNNTKDVPRPVEEKERARASGGRVLASNINHEPSEAQKKAGNYAKDHVHVHGLDITIENAKGGTRSGKGSDGKEWKVTLPSHYGYIKRTEGSDGDHLDVYLGPHTRSDKVYVVNQMKLPEETDAKKDNERNTRAGQNSGISRLVEYQGSMQQSKQSSRTQLQSKGDQYRSGMGQVHAVPGTRREKTESEIHIGKNREQQRIHSGKRSVGNSEGTSTKHAEERLSNSERQNANYRSVGGRNELSSINHSLQDQSREDDPRGSSIDPKARGEKTFDEVKIMLGFRDLKHAIETYEKAFSDSKGYERIGSIVPMSVKQLKEWIKTADTKEPAVLNDKEKAEKALPANHKLGMKVPKGGSSCATCRFHPTPTTCGNKGFIEWNSGKRELPAPADEYCCDNYQIGKKK